MPTSVSHDITNIQLIVEGKIGLGPLGAPEPTSPTLAFPPAFTEIGYYSEDGFAVNPQPGDETEYNGHNGDVVETDQLPGHVTLAFSALEARKEVVEAYWDTTVEDDGSFLITKASVDTYRSLIGAGFDKNGDVVMYYCPRVKVSEREEISHNRTSLLSHSMTFRSFRDSELGAHAKVWHTALAEDEA